MRCALVEACLVVRTVCCELCDSVAAASSACGTLRAPRATSLQVRPAGSVKSSTVGVRGVLRNSIGVVSEMQRRIISASTDRHAASSAPAELGLTEHPLIPMTHVELAIRGHSACWADAATSSPWPSGLPRATTLSRETFMSLAESGAGFGPVRHSSSTATAHLATVFGLDSQIASGGATFSELLEGDKRA